MSPVGSMCVRGIGWTLAPPAGSVRTGAGQSSFRLAWVHARGPIGSLGSRDGTAQSLGLGRTVGTGVDVGSGVASDSAVAQSLTPSPTSSSVWTGRVHRYSMYASLGMWATPSGGSNSAAGCSPNAISVTSLVPNWPGMG